MPVRKFRSVDEMNRPTWRQPGDQALYQTIAALWETGRRLQQRRFAPGVHKFRSVEELEAAADAN
jgi:hypothetical protein